MAIEIDGISIEVEGDKSILDLALESDIYIPHLCKHPDLEALGGCRLCVVEIDGEDKVQPSCKTLARDGMKISTKSDKAEKARKMAMELILVSHPADCTGCPKYGKCELQSMYQYMGVGPEKWRKKSRTFPTDDSNPLIRHLFTRCIRCGRCIRACRDLRGVQVLDYQKTKDGVRAGITEGVSLKDAGCKFCGACIEVCPTGSIVDSLGLLDEGLTYDEAVVPCRTACPANIDIPRYLRYLKEEDYGKAHGVIREKVPFPEILGSVCNHLCEQECKRNELGDPISICKLKKAVSINDHEDLWKKNMVIEEATGKKVAIVGAGPAGLAAAYYLNKKGHQVVVYEDRPKAGGQCRYGIPSYRLSDDLLDREIKEILDLGIELKLNTRIEDPKSLLGDYDSVLMTTGTHQGIKLPLEGNDLEGVMVNTDFLKAVRLGEEVKIGKRVMVLGGGNVAYDCGRTAIRLGAEEVYIACLESKEKMTATEEEIREGEEEGIVLYSGHSFLRIVGNESVEGVEIQEVDKFYFDENRKVVIDLVEGSKRIVEVDNVIFAVGQKPEGTENMGLDLVNRSYIKVDENLKTSQEGIFAAGDVVTGTKSVIEAIVGARKSAEAIDLYLGGDGDIREVLVEVEAPNPYIGRCEGFADQERIEPSVMDVDKRVCSFAEMVDPLESEQAIKEASRCLQCDLRLNLKTPKLWNEYKEEV